MTIQHRFDIVRLAAAGLICLGLSLPGCVDLDVTNTQEPDRGEALNNAAAVQNLLAGSFDVLWGALHSSDFFQLHINHLFANLGTQNTTTTSWGAVQQTRQPRPSFDNAPDLPAFAGPHGPRNLFADMNQILSTSYDVLRRIRLDGMTFTEGEDDELIDYTPRAEAYARFMQGVARGYLAMIFDQEILIGEDEELDDDIIAQSIESLVPYDQGLEAALVSLDEAISISQASTFSFPSSAESQLWFGSERALTNQDLAQLANTMAARFIVLNARTPEERAAADWNRVLQYTANGLTWDFGVTLSSEFRSSYLYSSSQALIEVSSPLSCCYRLDYKVVGPADTTGAYQAWINSDVATRVPFVLGTPDRRISGPPSPFTGNPGNGAYVRFRSNHNGFNAAEGLYRQSHYQWGRHAIRTGQSAFGSGFQVGTAYLATADENNLLRAEALLRTGDPAGAADLINITRTRSQVATGEPNLPPVTAAGVLVENACVPRMDDGSCGTLMTALRYERILEMLNTDALYGYADMRGFGMLPEGTFLQQPIPGNELDLMQLPNYTYGGGLEFSAVYSPVN